MKHQKGYTLTELLIVLGLFLGGTLGLGIVGVLVWALIKMVLHVTG